MFVITTVLHGVINAASPITLGQAGIEIPELMGTELTFDMILKVNLSAMLVCLAMGGVCFMFSGIFNQSKYSVAFSGTFVGVSILANMMAMFGSLGVDALENFKYLHSVLSVGQFLHLDTDIFEFPLCLLHIGYILFYSYHCLKEA